MDNSNILFFGSALIVVLLVVIAAFVARLGQLRKELAKTAKALEKLDARLGEQERQLIEIKGALDKAGTDPIAGFIKAFRKWRTKGLVPALTLLGTQLFRAYLRQRRQKALPPMERSEK